MCSKLSRVKLNLNINSHFSRIIFSDELDSSPKKHKKNKTNVFNKTVLFSQALLIILQRIF